MKKIVVLMLSIAVLTNCYAQKKPKKSEKQQTAKTEIAATEEEDNQESLVVTEECLVNLSLFNESARNKQYADAYEPWLQVFNNCPTANRAIYSHGRNILRWKLEQQTNDGEYQKIFNLMMKMYNQRMKYFGDDEKYPTPWIKGIKALDYINYVKNDELKIDAYKWLEDAIDGLGAESEIEFIRQFVLLSTNIYASDNTHAEKYIADYLKANEVLESMAEDDVNGNGELAAQYKNGLDIVFAESGAADCSILDNLYIAKVAENVNDITYLNKVMNLYRRVKCSESKVYFDASVKAYKIEPSAESASALANIAFTQDRYQEAVNYYEEATRLSDNNADKADFQYYIAQIYYSKLKNYPRTKTHALNSLEYDAANGKAHMIIGLAYAAAKGIYDDPVLSKSVYWVAVDRFMKAKQVDPSLTDDVDKLIATYRRHFPSKEDIFFKPELQDGKSFYVGGWIGETTTCR